MSVFQPSPGFIQAGIIQLQVLLGIGMLVFIIYLIIAASRRAIGHQWIEKGLLQLSDISTNTLNRAFRNFIANRFLVFVFVAGILSKPGFCQEKNSDTWHYLFDGSDLAQWDTYLGPSLTRGPDGSVVRGSTSPGLNNDTRKVFSIVDVDGRKALRVSGEVWGGISTRDEFENYHLQFQFKWGEKRWPPKENDRRDSGLLYHGIGEHGAGDGFWLRSQEFQIQEQDCGDYWGVAGAMFDIPATRNADSSFQYSPKGNLVTFSQDSDAGRHCKKFPDTERASGEWNTIDLYCFGDTAVHVVNGTVTTVLHKSRYSRAGKDIPLTRGKIQLQSESAEVFYRDIKIRGIRELPTVN